MKLSYYCSNQGCKKENYIKTIAINRSELQKEIGSELNERCKHCGSFTKRHINRLHAEPNNLIILVGILLSVIFTIFSWNFIGLISTLTASIPIAIWTQQKKKASAFNSTMVK